jgi:hypothetical protein
VVPSTFPLFATVVPGCFSTSLCDAALAVIVGGSYHCEGECLPGGSAPARIVDALCNK